MRLAGVAKVLAVRGRLPGANCSTARLVIAYLPSLTSVLHRDSLRRSAILGIARVSVPEAGTLSPPRGTLLGDRQALLAIFSPGVSSVRRL